MRIESSILELENKNDFSVEYIEKQIAQKGIVPLRWAIVKVEDDKFWVNTAYLTV